MRTQVVILYVFNGTKNASFTFCWDNQSTFQWLHPLTAQFSTNDSKLLVSGVVSEIRGEIAIYDTGRESQSRPSRESKNHGNYRILNRVVNDPYDTLGSWCSDRFFSTQRNSFQYLDVSWKGFISAFID